MEKDYPKRKLEVIDNQDFKKDLELISNDKTSKSNNKPPKKKMGTEDYNAQLYPSRESVRITKKTNSTGINPYKTIE